jgi:hypothetical protein
LKLLESINRYLTEIQLTNPEDPFGHGLISLYAPRGGLGLYVQNGAASYRRVVIEPLEVTE